MSSWEAQDGKRTFYISIGRTEVVIGSHYGSGHTDNAGAFSFEEMRKGGWDAHIERYFGADVLAQVRAAIAPVQRQPERTSDTSDPPDAEWEDFD